MSIHPTAIIHADAQLGSDVVIGPYVVIEGAAQIGDGCVIQAHAVICAHVNMGKNNLIGYSTVVGSDPQDFAFKPDVKSGVRIGDGNKIREHCTVHRGSSEGSATIIGDGCFLMAGTHLGHNVRLGNQVIIANDSLLGGHVTVEDRVFIGGNSVFHQHTRVGELAICQGASGFSKDVPPFTIGVEHNFVAGLNIIGLRRAGFTPATRAEIKEAFQLIYRRGLNTAQALAASREKAWGPEANAFFGFIEAAKKRGICAYIGTKNSAAGQGTDQA
ncbi:MAG: Acyl-[acyl-carrier-protein]--UDP-N-acetylglucosamine O-acyltransferase [Chthoniobacteraceae bacterium]|nr:Acyl-[acyl-carrier-protein]--UDP-N-acetylglucosamine O-acyltransferase [Chthoniobacteraceae bacterium]